MEELNITVLVGGEELDRGQECAAHNELDQWWSRRHREEEDRAKEELSVEEGVRKDWPEEDWEEDTTIIFEEWLVLEMSKLYSPVQDKLTSNTHTHSPTKTVALICETNILRRDRERDFLKK